MSVCPVYVRMTKEAMLSGGFRSIPLLDSNDPHYFLFVFLL